MNPKLALNNKILKKKILLYNTDILESVAAKFILNLVFVQIFIGLYWLKIRIFYSLHYVLKHKNLHNIWDKCNKLAGKLSSL